MITTKEIYLNFNKGIATATININHLVKKITIISIAVNENTYMVSYAIKAPLLLPHSDDILCIVHQDFQFGGVNICQTSLRHIFRNRKPINGTYTFQLFDFKNVQTMSNVGYFSQTIVVIQFDEDDD